MFKGFLVLFTVLALSNIPITDKKPEFINVIEPSEEKLNINPEQIKTKNKLLHTKWTKGYDRRIDRQNRFNNEIQNSLEHWNELDPLIFKSLIVQESELRTACKNRYGYAGIMQIGPKEARSLGLIKRSGDQRYTPYYAIPAAVKLLKRKTLFLELTAFKKYGTPSGDEYWKFVVAAYNAGEGTIYKAIRYAYGKRIPKELKFDDLLETQTGNPWESPLVQAMPRRWRKIAKYKEIKTYVENIIKRARQS